MSAHTIAKIDEIYHLCAKLETPTILRVQHHALRSFLNALRLLSSALVADSSEFEWGHFFMRTRRLARALIWNPLPLKFSAPLGEEWTSYSENFLIRCRKGYPGAHSALTEVIKSVSALALTIENPLIDGLTRLGNLRNTGRHAILMRDIQYATQVQEELCGRIPSPMSIVTHHDLRGDIRFSTITIMGGMSLDWVPSFVFNAPRTTLLSGVQWQGGPIEHDFAKLLDFGLPGQQNGTDSERSTSLPQRGFKIIHSLDDSGGDGNDGATLEYLWHDEEIDELVRRTVNRSDTADHENINARLYLLENRNAVFLPDSPGQKVSVFDIDDVLEGNESGGTAKLDVRDLRVGDFLALRTQGAGDLLIDIANRIMGKQSSAIRANQFGWKSLLRELVTQKGLLEVSIMLLDQGSLRANEPNVRHWISEDNIRPDSDDDFLAILKVLGNGYLFDRLADEAKIIDSAHRRAGHRIRSALLKRASSIDIGQLLSSGRIDIELDDEDAGTLTAIRIVSRTDKTMPVPRHLTQKLIPLDESVFDVSLESDREKA